jgi:hypothetical protein
MNYIMGIKLNNINVQKGAEHDKVSAEVFMDSIKVGELINDGWCDEFYIEFIDDNFRESFEEKMKKYYKRKKIKSSIYERFIKELLFINKEYNTIFIKESNLRCEQLTFLWN